MASFAFIVDFEEGHLLATMGLSKSLQQRGHVVHYIGILDIKKTVVEQGFEFHSILENQFPKGFREKFKKDHRNRVHYSKVTFFDCVEKELPILFERIKPQGIIMSTYLSLEALLIHYRYGINPVIFMPVINSLLANDFRLGFDALRNKRYDVFQEYRNFNTTLKDKKPSLLKRIFGGGKKKIDKDEYREFISPLEHFKQIIACPEQFELPGHVRNNVHYIGPCIRNKTDASATLLEELKGKNKKIVYVSMGSQTERIHQVCEALYSKIFLLMSDPAMSDYHAVLSSASVASRADSISIPENITIVPWIDALEILEISSAIITHGGLGLIKESIYYGVPMIVLPDKYDQPLNAERVAYHQLGVQDDLITVTVDSLKSHLQKVTTDQNIREKLQEMKAIFRRKDELQEGAILLENIFTLN